MNSKKHSSKPSPQNQQSQEVSDKQEKSSLQQAPQRMSGDLLAEIRRGTTLKKVEHKKHVRIFYNLNS